MGFLGDYFVVHGRRLDGYFEGFLFWCSAYTWSLAWSMELDMVFRARHGLWSSAWFVELGMVFGAWHGIWLLDLGTRGSLGGLAGTSVDSSWSSYPVVYLD